MRSLFRVSLVPCLWVSSIIGSSLLASDPGLPLMTRHPGDKLVSIGGSTTLAPQVSSPSPPLYQWCFNGLPMGGQTNLSLTISECSRANSGWYVLKVQNDAGQIASTPAFVKVQGNPAGTLQFRNKTSNRIISSSGGYANGVSIKLFTGPAPERITWTGATAVVNSGLFVGDTVSLPFAAPGQSVYIRAELSDGQLSNLIPVVAGNGPVGGTLDALRFPTFTEWPAPIINSHPLDHEVNVGDELELKIEFVDYSQVTVKWSKDGNPAPVFEEIVRLGSFTTTRGTSTLRIPSTTLADAGNYKVILLSESGDTMAVSESASVKVVVPPAGQIHSIALIADRLFIQAGGRPNRVYTLEFKSSGSKWVELFSQSSQSGLFTFPNLNLPGSPTWFRLRSSH